MSLPVTTAASGASPPRVMTWHIPFMSRKCPIDDIALKIKKILNFVTSVSTPFAEPPALRLKKYTQLSATDYQVMVLIGKGLNHRDIAKELNRSRKTTGAHYRSVSRKMGAANRAEFYRYACFIASLKGDRRNTLFL